MNRGYQLPFLVAWVVVASVRNLPLRTTHYRIDIESEQVTDASVLGGTLQRQSVRVSGFLAITLADTIGGMTLDAVLDSMASDSTSTVPSQALQGARGASWHGQVSTDGKVTGLTAVQPHPVASIFFEEVLARFYPRTAAADSSWCDTIETTTAIPNGSRTTRTVTNYRRSGQERWASIEGQAILSAFSSGITAVQQTPQGRVDLEGTGQGKASQYVATDGVYLGGLTQDSVNIVASGGPLSRPLPITIVTTITTTALP